MRVKGLSLFAALLCVASHANAQEEVSVLPLSLGEAIQFALGKNFTLQVEEFSPQIAQARQLTASGRFDPTLQVSYTYDENRQELRTLTSTLDVPTPVPGEPDPELFALRGGQELDASVSGLLPTGTTYSLGASVDVDGDSQRAPQFDRYNSFAGLNLTQPLLRNFGTDVNLAAIRIARANYAISQWQLRSQIIDIVTRTVFVYNDLYFSIRNLEVERQSSELALQLVRDNEKRAEIGVMSPLDVVQAQADLASREERMLVAERDILDNQNFLKQLVTDDIASFLDTRVVISRPPGNLDFLPERDEDFPLAFELRPDYRQALLDIQKRNINVIFTRNQALPRLDLIGSLGVNGISTDLSDSISRLGSDDTRNLAWAVGAVFSVPIPNRTGQGEVQAAQLEIAQALVSLKRLEQTILLEVDNAAGQIVTTLKRIDASRAAREFAQRTLEAAQTRLASGTTTTFEVLQFQRDFAAAQIAEVRAFTDHNKAVAEYARVTGTTLRLARIELE